MTLYQTSSVKVGIDDISAYIPSIYLPIEALATARDLEYAKLNLGLGLTSMSLADVGEDAATMAANAVLELIRRNKLDPRTIGRLYLGTESALDGAKPTATYILDMLLGVLSPEYGPDCLLNCDVVDLTFACIGAVDAMQNSIDWVRGANGRIAIVVASDDAKYELGSGGEYTQGAGAIALLIRHQPRLLAFGEQFGVATRPVHDFFKPQVKVSKEQIVREVLQLAGISDTDARSILDRIPDSIETSGVLDSNEAELILHRNTPVFDGPYSNDCYQQRIGEALVHFARLSGHQAEEAVTDRWARLVFHLPYAFQARRMFPEIYLEETRRRGELPALLEKLGMEMPDPAAFADEKAYQKAYAEFLRLLAKSKPYRAYVSEKIEKGERASSLVGNLYTGSIFLALMSSLEADWAENQPIQGGRIGFFAYGSGSKSKVFEAEVQPQWRDIVARFQLTARLEKRQAIDYETYEALHRGMLQRPIGPVGNCFLLEKVEMEKPNYIGARTYRFHSEVAAPVA